MRNYKIDNLKAILIFSVVFGHLIENNPTAISKFIYIIIYLFHMPLFAYCSGIFSTYNIKKIFNNLIYPYIVFQIIYLFFVNQINNINLQIQITTPYWLLWYLLALVFWKFIIHLLPFNSKKEKITLLIISFILSIIVGLDTTVGYYLTLSRMIVFLPFFLLGNINKNTNYLSNVINKFKLKKNINYSNHKISNYILLICVLFILMISYLISNNLANINIAWLYGSYSYQTIGYNSLIRLGCTISSLVFLCFFLLVIPNKKFPVISNIGKSSMQIFLLHGFLILIIREFNLFSNSLHPIFDQLIITLLIIIVLSQNIIKKMTKHLIEYPF